MNAPHQGSPPLLPNQMARQLKVRLQEERAWAARQFASWMALAGALVCFGLSWWSSWPLGPDFVDEGGVTRIRIAIATLVVGQALAFAFLIFYLRDILVQVKRLTDDSSKAFENPGRSETGIHE